MAIYALVGQGQVRQRLVLIYGTADMTCSHVWTRKYLWPTVLDKMNIINRWTDCYLFILHSTLIYFMSSFFAPCYLCLCACCSWFCHRMHDNSASCLNIIYLLTVFVHSFTDLWVAATSRTAKAQEAAKEETAVQTDIAEDGEEANANDLRNTKPRK